MRKSIAQLLLAICVIGAFLRLYDLKYIPNSLSADEAAFGYNAYSILKTGRDEFGHFLPLYFQSFDDYKNPVFGYYLIPFIALFGLTEWSIRFGTAVSGILTLPVFFLLTQKFSSNTRLALLTTLFAAISPWLIQYSRVAIDMELALFWSVLALWLFLQGNNKPIYYLFSAISFGLSFYTYHSSRVWVIAFGAVLFLLYRRYLINRYAVSASGIFLIFLLPYFVLLTTTKIGLRPYAISVFADKETVNQEAQRLLKDKEQGFSGAAIFHNRRFTYLNQAVGGFLKILQPELLFGQSKYNQISTTRLFYLWQLPLLLFGIKSLWQQKKLFFLLGAWLAIGFIPGALTQLPVFDRRIFLNSFPLLFLSAAGLSWLITQSQLLKHLVLTKILLVCLITVSFIFYLHNYFVDGRREIVELWGNGMKELVMTTEKTRSAYKQTFVSLKLNQTLSFFLFYTQYAPGKYLAEGGTISGGYLDERNKFATYRFKFITPADMALDTLYVWSVNEVQPCLKPFTTTAYTDSTPHAHLGIFDPAKPQCQEWLTQPQT